MEEIIKDLQKSIDERRVFLDYLKGVTDVVSRTLKAYEALLDEYRKVLSENPYGYEKQKESN